MKKNYDVDEIDETTITNDAPDITGEEFEEQEINLIKKTDEGHQIEEIMKLYHSGNKADMQEAGARMCNLLERLVQYIINNRYYGCSETDREDMKQEAYLNILLAMSSYDYTVSSPTTFFRYHILDGLKRSHNQNENTTAYTAQLLKRIRQLISELNSQNLTYTEESIVQIISLRYGNANYSAATIRDCYREVCAKTQYVSVENNDAETEIKDYGVFDTPEAVLLKKEDSKSLYDAMNFLPKIEKYVLSMSMGIYQTDIDLLSEILHTYTKFEPFELSIANGTKPVKTLLSFGFKIEEIVSLYGINYEDAAFYAENIKNKENPRVIKIHEDMVSERGQANFFNNLTTESLKKALMAYGHSSEDIEDILSGRRSGKTFLPASELPVQALLRGKGLKKRDIDKILNGQPLSNVKIAPILNLKQNDINGITTRALSKLKRKLINTTDRTERKDGLSGAINDTNMKLDTDMYDFVKGYYDLLEDCGDEIVLEI